jgi:hypothetical protein
MLSGWLVATRHLPRNLAHARISYSYQGFSPGMRTVLGHPIHYNQINAADATLYLSGSIFRYLEITLWAVGVNIQNVSWAAHSNCP